MRRLLVPALLLLASCSLQQTSKSNLPEPTIELNQLSRVQDPTHDMTSQVQSALRLHRSPSLLEVWVVLVLGLGPFRIPTTYS